LHNPFLQHHAAARIETEGYVPSRKQPGCTSQASRLLLPPDLAGPCPWPDGPASCKRPRRLLRIPRVSSGPWAPVALPRILTGRKQQQSVVAQSLPEGVLDQGAGFGGRDRAGTERMRVRRRLFGHPLDAYVCCFAFRPSFVCLGKGEKHAFDGHLPICLGVAPIRYAFSTVSHGDHTFTCQSACHARYATRVGGRRLFPHNCSNAVEKGVRRYRGCGRWRAPCRRRDRLRLTGWLTWLLASHPRPGSADRLVRSCTEERSPDARSVDYCMNGGDWGRTTLRTSAWRYGCVWFVLLHRQALPIHSTFGCTKAASGMWAALAR